MPPRRSLQEPGRRDRRPRIEERHPMPGPRGGAIPTRERATGPTPGLASRSARSSDVSPILTPRTTTAAPRIACATSNQTPRCPTFGKPQNRLHRTGGEHARNQLMSSANAASATGVCHTSQTGRGVVSDTQRSTADAPDAKSPPRATSARRSQRATAIDTTTASVAPHVSQCESTRSPANVGARPKASNTRASRARGR